MIKSAVRRKPSDPKRMKWALITSVSLNLLFAGLVVAHLVSFQAHRPEKMMMKDLPESIAVKLNKDLSAHMTRARFNFKKDVKDRQKLIEDFKAGASLEDVQKRAKQLNQNRCAARQEMQEIMLQSIYKLSAEEREKVLESKMLGKVIR